MRQERIALTVIIVGISSKAQLIGHEIGESLCALTIADCPEDPDQELSTPQIDPMFERFNINGGI